MNEGENRVRMVAFFFISLKSSEQTEGLNPFQVPKGCPHVGLQMQEPVLSSKMTAKVESSLAPGKGQTRRTQARVETRGSGKGEVKEMSSVCGGSLPRDGAKKKKKNPTGPNSTVPHTEWTPLAVFLRSSSSSFYFPFL